MIHTARGRAYAADRSHSHRPLARPSPMSSPFLSSSSPPPAEPSPAALARPARFWSPDALAALTTRLAGGAGALDRSGRFPFDNIAALHDSGLVAAVVPRAAGGGGAALADARRIVSAVARGEPSTALVLTMTWLIHRQLSRPE